MPHKPKTHESRLKEQGGKSRLKSYNERLYEFKRANDPALNKAKQIRSSGRWQKVRAEFLKANPLCFDPFDAHVTERVVVPAQQVHHIQGLIVRPDLAFYPDNLAGLCTGCHAKLEAMERANKRTAYLFVKE